MKPSVIVRMGAAHWDVQIKNKGKPTLTFDLRTMDKRQRSNFHREFMNAFRATHN